MTKQTAAPRPKGARRPAEKAHAVAATSATAHQISAPVPTSTPAIAPEKRGAAAVDLRIYRAVINAVMSHRLPPGTRLAETDFCELYQVSRTTVRKALQRLAHDHIIELRPNRGAVIASPSPKETRDVFAARRALEREVIPLVVRTATESSLRAIRAAIDAEEHARRSGDRANWIRLGGEFHLLLAELSGNAVLQRFMGELVSRCSLIIALYEIPGAPMCANDEHADLLALIEGGKVKQAVALIEHHLLEIEARLNLEGPVRKIDLARALAED
jgi:DNA-binding GntR family transcriptional regulator